MTIRRQLLLAAYVVILLGPLAFMLAGRNPAGSGFIVLTSVGVSSVAFAGIALQFVLASRWRTIARPFGADLLVRFHRAMGLGVFSLVALHVVLILIDRRDRLTTIIEDVGYIAGFIGLLALMLLSVLSWPRPRPQHRYEMWKALHGALGTLVLVATFVHVIRVGHFATNDVIAWLMAVTAGVALTTWFALRILRPFRFARGAFRLASITPERGDAITITLAPERGTLDQSWYPGQFGWIKLASRPYDLAEHPFSMSSSAAERTSISFTCKVVGDFTRQLMSLPTGTRLVVDGPHGSYRPAMKGAPRMLVVAGSGIAPAMSILRTMSDVGDSAPVQLIYGIRSMHSATFAEALDFLRARLNLRIDFVATQESPSWTGPRGRIDENVLRTLAPRDLTLREAFVCGAPRFVDDVGAALMRMGIPRDQLHMERF
jgi:predicted ferric reductase